MPKLEPKQIQKELESGKLRPVYWLFGPERMKKRELVRRIQKAALQGQTPNDFNLEKWESSETSIETILDSAQSFSMGGGTKLILVRNADELKNLEPLVDYLKEEKSELDSILVFIANQFDGRKKTSKVIADSAAVVACEEVSEPDREAWVEFLAKRRGIQLSIEERTALRGLEPWALDIVDQELSKLELVIDDATLRSESLMSGTPAYARDEFIDAIFSKNLKRALELVHLFHADLEVQLPFLGLLAWNLRQLKLFLLEKETQSRSSERRNPFLERNLERWRRHWDLKSLSEFEAICFKIDFSLKNTRALGVGLWANALFKITDRSEHH